MHDRALDLLREAVVDKGYWYSSDHLGDDDLEPLRARPEFGNLVELCKEREEKEHRDARSELELVQPRSSENGKWPALVIAMHGNQLNIHATRLNWCGNALSDCIVALPQSSHGVCTGAYSWVDPAVGSVEVRSHLEEIFLSNVADRGRLIMGGFSAGARVAVHMLFKDRVKARGVILVSPWLPDLEALEQTICDLRSAEVKVYLICGDQDKDCFESTNRLADLFRSNDMPF
jgi:poly(3-hydroxybutyrate) depolymerase